MKRFVQLIFLAVFPACALAQNVGVDVATPQQKLDVAGALKIGNTTTGAAGSLRWNGTEFQFHDGTQWITLNANTDDQVLDVIQLNGNDLEISIESDGQATHTIDLSSFLDNTDNQTFDQVSINGSNQLLLSLEDDGQATHVLDLSGYLDNTDNQTFDIVQLSGSNLELSLEDDGLGTHVIDLSSFLDNTDDQTLDVAQLTGNNLELSLEDDGQATHSIDLSGFLDNTDDQTFDVINITSDELRLSLEADGQATHVLNLAPYKDNTDDQQFDVVQLSGNTLQLSLEDDGQATHSIDLSGFADNTDDQTIDVLSLSGNTLNISLEDDGQANQTLDLSQFADNTDDQAVTTFGLSGTDLQLQVESDAGGLQTVDLDPLRRLLTDDDGDTRVEVELNADEDKIRFTTDGGGAMMIDEFGNVGVALANSIENKLVVNGTASDSRSVLGLRSGNAQNSFSDGAQIAFGYDGDDAYQHFIHTRHNSSGGSTNNAIDFYVTDGTQYNTVNSGSTHVMSLNSGNVGIGTTAPDQLLHVAGTGRFNALAGGGTRNVTVNNNGDLQLGSSDIGDITGVTAGNGLTGGGTAGAITLDAVALNGLTTSANDIRLGGTLVQATTITQGTNNMVFNMNSSGDFHIQDNGTNHFSVVDNGDSYFGSDVYWRDGSTGGTILGRFIDSGDDGTFDVYRNGAIQHRINGDGTTYFNEQSADQDFRIESNNETAMFFVDGGLDRIGFGTTTPQAWVHLYENGLVPDDGVTDMLRIEVNRNDHGTTPSGPAILFKDQDANNGTNEARIKMMTVNGTAYGDNDEATSNLVFETTDAGTASDKMIITGRGNVGIGALNPTERLHVNGNLRLQGVGSNGSNTRILTVDGNGTVRYRDAGSWTYAGVGDNLGNHTATTAITMNDNNINDADDISVNRLFDGDGSDNIEVHDHLMMRDNLNLRLGNGSDMRMWHNGSNHYFRDYQHGAGNIYFQGEDSGGTNEALLYMYTNGGSGYVRLYYGSSEKLETTSTGFQVNNANTIRSQPSGDYGSIQVDGDGKGAYEGYSINGRYVLMNDDDNTIGLYNDLNNRWVWLYERNDRLDIYDPDYAANSVAWRFDNNQQVSYRDINMTDDDIWDANYVECNYLRDGDGGSAVELYDDFNMLDNDIWDVENMTVNTIFDTDGTDVVHFDQTRVRIDAGSSRDWWFEQYAGHPHLRSGQAGWGFIGRFNNYPGYIYSTREYRTYEYGLSDERVKLNIKPLDRTNSLAKIMQLQGKKYDLNKETHPFLGIIEDEQQELDTKNNIGFIAQELMQVVPEMVVYDEESGYYMIKNYEQLFPIIVEAMKEQQVQIENLKQGVGQRKISDFGTAQMDGEFAWIEFDSEFSSLLVNGEIPVVSVTPNELGAEIAVVEKTSKGFKVRKVGTNPLSFDWTAHAKLKSISTYQDYMNPTVDKALVERLNNPQVQHPSRYERHLAEEEQRDKERAIEAAKAAEEQRLAEEFDAKMGGAPYEEDPKGMDAGVGGTGLNDEPYPEKDIDPDPNAPVKEVNGASSSEDEASPRNKD